MTSTVTPTSTASAAPVPAGAGAGELEPPLEQVVPGLLASAPEELPFGRELRIRAYLLRRPQGNLLIYRSGELPRQRGRIERAGGIARHYLNHAHEAAPVNDWVGSTFGAPLFVHAADAAQTRERNRVRASFSRRHRLDDDFEVIPTPGHTPGATAYLWDSGRHRVLFPGDTLLLGRRGWRAAFLEGTSDRRAYVASLLLLAGLDFDLIVPGISRRGRSAWQFFRPERAREELEAIAARLRAGGSG